MVVLMWLAGILAGVIHVWSAIAQVVRRSL